ncbi:hypothetical protein CKAN_00779900 [Cinnamomum micranthum f. kanehirae]|uniref:Uncharacterized protein n=1 Tax=Cinnamomum micranthum f. kanehirae TaxID=337451 RepID=A0A3S3MTG2_9MAGN|nr:hypothetical protein CKAN_00779900 [Cinnamomum micranthum f. kanehirae]
MRRKNREREKSDGKEERERRDRERKRSCPVHQQQPPRVSHSRLANVAERVYMMRVFPCCNSWLTENWKCSSGV